MGNLSAMADTPTPQRPDPATVVEPTEILQGAPSARPADAAEEEPQTEQVEQPAKVMRVGSMVKQLLDEVRQQPLDEAGRQRLREIYDLSVLELSSSLSTDLADELRRLSLPFSDGTPSEAELRIAQAQLVGWLEGLFHGIQATLMAQQMAARAQLQEMRQQQGLPPGSPGVDPRPGTYL
jgi:hypothetical protein